MPGILCGCALGRLIGTILQLVTTNLVWLLLLLLICVCRYLDYAAIDQDRPLWRYDQDGGETACADVVRVAVDTHGCGRHVPVPATRTFSRRVPRGVRTHLRSATRGQEERGRHRRDAGRPPCAHVAWSKRPAMLLRITRSPLRYGAAGDCQGATAAA